MALKIENCDIDIHEILQNSDLRQDVKDNLSKSTIILFPAAFPTSIQRGNFPSETPNLLRYIRDQHPEIKVGIFENTGE